MDPCFLQTITKTCEMFWIERSIACLFIALWSSAALQRHTSYLCKQTNVCVLKRQCVRCGSFSITAFKPWCNGASGQPRTACVLSDYEQIRSTRLSLFGCVCQDWNGLEQTAHGVAMHQWFAFTCTERHRWLTRTDAYTPKPFKTEV